MHKYYIIINMYIYIYRDKYICKNILYYVHIYDLYISNISKLLV